MKKISLLLPIIIILVSCSDESKIQDIIRDNVNDPQSAIFKNLNISEDGKRSCIVWNAKNKMGGYGDWTISKLTKMDSHWTLTNIKTTANKCDFKAIDAAIKAKNDEMLILMEKLIKARSITPDNPEILAINSECIDLQPNQDFIRYIESDAEHRVLYKKYLELFKPELDSGDCETIAQRTEREYIIERFFGSQDN